MFYCIRMICPFSCSGLRLCSGALAPMLASVQLFTSKKKRLWGRGPSVLPPVLELGAGYPVPRSGVVVYHISL